MHHNGISRGNLLIADVGYRNLGAVAIGEADNAFRSRRLAGKFRRTRVRQFSGKRCNMIDTIAFYSEPIVL